MKTEDKLIKAQEQYIDYLAKELNRLAGFQATHPYMQLADEVWEEGVKMREEIQQLTLDLKNEKV